jgi:hypothetical protein
MKLTGESTRRKTCLSATCRPQITHGQTGDRTRASAVRGLKGIKAHVNLESESLMGCTVLRDAAVLFVRPPSFGFPHRVVNAVCSTVSEQRTGSIFMEN